MSRLCLSFLGPVEASIDGASIASHLWLKHLALLVYLAVEADRPHRRETLAGLFWPEQPECAARHSLREAFYQLHRAFGPHFADYLTVTNQTAQFNPHSDYALDVADFTALIAQTMQHDHQQLEICDCCLAWLQEAIALYQGPFLAELCLKDSFAFDEWALLKRDQLGRMALSALYTLAEHYRLCGDFAQMEEMARRQIEISLFHEDAHRQVMAALIGQGHQAAALGYYAQFRQMLADELGVSPERKTSALCAQIQTGQLDRLAQSANSQWLATAFDGCQPALTYIATPDAENPEAHFLVLVCPIGMDNTCLARLAATQSGDAVQDRPCLLLLAEAGSAEEAATAVLNTLSLSPIARLGATNS
jgi:DNA-binding SARP family transcriptional activator